MKQKIFERILFYLWVAFAIYLIIELIKKILGGSLTTDNLVIGFLMGIVTMLFKVIMMIYEVDRKLTAHISWHKGRASR
ncbi:hypothetical protein KY362_02080 [Candidatus Woesearchaeota archaeon]|nr:hypothetical protein [Candidatus Woesearchaeota archaeon]